MRLAAVLFCLALAGCGAVYTSPNVSRGVSGQDGTRVRVVPITAETVLAANRAPYRPRQLPAAFDRVAQAPGMGRIETPPAPVLDPEQRPSRLDLRAPPQIPDRPYRIGVGDVLVLATPPAAADSVAQLTGLLAAQNRRQGYTVQDDGAIAVPDVGRVQVAGMSLEEAEARIFQALVENQITPSFSVEIAEFNSQSIAVGGAVGQPRPIPITLTPLTLDRALAAAGGLAATEDQAAAIRIYRNGDLYQIPVRDYLARSELQNVRLLDGDSVFVDIGYDLDRAEAFFEQQIRLAEFRQRSRREALDTLKAEMDLRRGRLAEARENFDARIEFGAEPRDYAYVTGEVVRRRRVALPFEQPANLSDVLFDEGGIPTRTGNVGQIYVLRSERDPESLGAITAWHLDAGNAAAFVLATRFELRPDDVIFVAEQPITKWNRVIQQFVPSLLNVGVAAANVSNG